MGWKGEAPGVYEFRGFTVEEIYKPPEEAWKESFSLTDTPPELKGAAEKKKDNLR